MSYAPPFGRLLTAMVTPFDSHGAVGVLDNRRIRGPLAALDDAELAALEHGLRRAGLLG